MSTTTTTATTGIHSNELREKEQLVSKSEVAEMFEKKFQYQKTKESQWQLPPAQDLFSEYYQLDNLQLLKERLNSVKSKLNDYVTEEWSVHTRRKDPAGEVPWRLKNQTMAEFVTVAWCKFFECLHQFPLVKAAQMNSLHLCEAPGAFIAALNHFLYSTYKREEVTWNWLSTTLNPYYEGNPLNKMIIDDRFMLYTLDNWLFHDDFTGNIIERDNIENMQRQCEQRLLGGQVHLITADGSIDCIETPDCQEEFVSQLHFAEICAALSILADGGCFVLKMFTLYEATSLSYIYLLNCVFETVHVFKPATSKRGNSENYIICLDFKGRSVPNFVDILELMKSKLNDANPNVLPMFQKCHFPKDFLMQHEICARLFMNLQINAIESNIISYELMSRIETRRSHILRTLGCNEYFRRYNVQPLPEELTILYNTSGVIYKSIKTLIYKGSYAERKHEKDITAAEKIFMLHGAVNELEKSLFGRYAMLLQEDKRKDEQSTNKHTKLALKVYRGKAFETLHSSLFAAVHVLLLRHKLQQIFQVDPLWQATPNCVCIKADDTDKKITLPHVCLPHFLHSQRKFMLDILMTLRQEQPQKLIFSNYAFLTHFAVSLLRVLALNCFQYFAIATHPQFEITLEHCTYDKETLTLLDTLIELLQGDDCNVLCVVDIMHLHRNEFCRALAEFNNLLLLNNFKLLLNN